MVGILAMKFGWRPCQIFWKKITTSTAEKIVLSNCFIYDTVFSTVHA